MSHERWTTAAVAVGANRSRRRATIESALGALAAVAGVRGLRRSSLYETAPVGPPGQGPYLNGAVVLETTRSPAALLDVLLQIERLHGRVRDPAVRNGSRSIDLDLLLHGSAVIDRPGLTVPHPRLHERAFVLVPLAEIAPRLMHPALGERVESLVRRCSGATVLECRQRYRG